MEAAQLVQGESSVSLDTAVFVFSLFDTGALLFLLVYYVITLSDLECDYLNAQQCCYRLNVWVIPKIGAHVVLSLVFLLTGHYYLLLASIPLAVFLIREYVKVPTGNFGVYDPTEIHRMGQLKTHMRDAVIGLAYYLVFFFICLYCLLTHLLRSNPLPKPDYADDTGL
ncbi:protein cornichon homolog 4-like [Homarus americanus]|uniref:protein cornichon homolog 4-like n=1 Tax=Homarus americanus TaxID=6706 RepID=UPI001C493C26|nr:protein cornichon homolog 4-like [Homarus americanus]